MRATLIVLVIVSTALIVAYLASAIWNLLNLATGDSAHIFSAATLPGPLASQQLPAWAPLTSVVVFLLLVALLVGSVRALSSQSSRRAQRDYITDAPAAIADMPPQSPSSLTSATGSVEVGIASVPDLAPPASDVQSFPPAEATGAVPTDQPIPMATPSPSSSPTAQPRVFISHSSADNTFGYALVEKLRAALGSVDAVWYDSRGETPDGIGWEGGIHPARYFEQEIFRELRARPVFVVLLSADALASPWVQDEILLAWKQKNERGRSRPKVIVPVVMPDAGNLVIPEPLNLIQYVSFVERRDWTADRAFDALLAAVHAEYTQLRPGEPDPPFDLAELPVPDPFIGREEDLQWVLDRLQPGATAGITAPRGLGGIGKTALAACAVQQVYDDGRFPSGIAIVDCRDVIHPVTVLKRVLTSFDPEGREPTSDNLRTLAEATRVRLAGRRALIVLDNVEPELDIETVLQRLRPSGAALLITSRDLLPLPPDATRPLELLPAPAALDLFAEWYLDAGSQPASQSPSQLLSSTDRALAERIVTAFGRHTLAVKLAGAEAHDLARSLASFAEEVEAHPLNLQGQGAHITLALKENLLRSVTRLPTAGDLGDTRRLFAALAIFVAPAEASGTPGTPDTSGTDDNNVERVRLAPSLDMGRQAVIAVARGHGLPAPERAVDLLVRRALLDPATDPHMPEDSDRERLRLHPLLRELAADLLDTDTTPGARDAAALALASFYADYADATLDAALGPDAATIAGALEWAYASAPDAVRDTLVASLCDGINLYWRDRGRTAASLRYLPWGIASLRALDDQDTARSRLGYLLRDYGWTHLTAGHTDEAERQFRAALQLFQDAQDDLGAAQLLEMIGRIEALRGHLELADQSYREAERVFRQLGEQRALGGLLNSIGDLARQRGQLAAAEDYYQQALVIMRETQNHREEGVVLSNLGQVARQRGQVEQAEEYFQQSLVIVRETQDRQGEGVDLAYLGLIAESRERWDDAERYYREGLRAVRATEDAANIASIASALGQLLIAYQGQPDEGCQLLGEAIAIYHRMGLEDNERRTRERAQELGCAL